MLSIHPWGCGGGVCWGGACSTLAQVGAVVARVGQTYREAAVALVAKAYTTIRIGDLATYLGQVLPPSTPPPSPPSPPAPT